MVKMFIAVLFAINFLIGQDCEEGSQWVETNDGHFECCPSANYMFDCDGNCYHISFYANFLGDGGCNMGKNTPNLNCEDYNLDDGDCIRDEHCGDGEVDDCADDDCCPENWIADGYPDCEDQQWGCDLTCYQNDGGDCGPLCEDEVECWDGSCAAYEDSCPVFGCEEGYLPDCSGDEVCCPESLSGCSTSTCDLTCYSEECLTGPDLVVDQATLLNSIYTSTINVSEDDCYIEENCVTGSGLRDLIRFTTEIGNIGNADFYLGPSGSSDDWEWAPCHGHWHFEQYAQYALYSYEETSPGQYDCTDQEIGHKNGWCVMDLADYTNDGTCQFQYGCSNMGISAGCSDIYNSGLDCQWLDITGIPDGEYILSVGTNVNMDHDLIHELNYDNNTANVRITLAGGNVSVGDIFDLNNCNGEVCEEEVDCAGVCGGNAVVDCAGVCGGDAVLSGCDNACNSTAVVDECGTCDSDASNDCVQDCAGTWGGDLEPDCCGACGGDNSQCSNCCGMPFPDDCSGVCCSEVCYDDYCGVCDDIPENDCVQDCAGTWGGDAVVDECGECDGDASNDCVQDCAGTWGGDLELDCGGVCGGDNSTALSCCGLPFYDDCTTDCYEDSMGTCCIEEDADECGLCFGDGSSCCEDGETNNDNPCNPWECDDGQWVEIIIDCAEQMGWVCDGGVYIPPEEGECCSECVLYGDLNGDGTTNVIDIVMAVDLILNNNYNAVGDINGDGVLNVIDIVIIVDMVLNP